MQNIDTLFLDIGGVLLTNGWDHQERLKTVQAFGLDWEDFDRRHAQYYPLHETDEMTLDEYLDKVVFWKKRDFSLQQIKEDIFTHSKPFPEMINLMKALKEKYHLRIAAVSNEGRDLAEYRISKFNLESIFDDFFVSCFVHYQKPDPHIFQMALDITHVPIDQVVYVDDRLNLIEAAGQLGIRGIQHVSLDETKRQLVTLLGTGIL